MPMAIVGVVAAVAGGVVGGLIGGVVGGIVGGLVYAGISLAGSLLFGPKAPAQEFVRGPETTLRGGAEPHQIVFGETRVYGVNVFAETFNAPGGDYNEYLNWVVVFAGHECEEITRLYINDDAIEMSDIDGDGYVIVPGYRTVRPSEPSFVKIHIHLGTDSQAADSELITRSDVWTSDHRLRGLCYIYFRLRYERDVFPNGIPNFSVVMKGDNNILDVRDASTGYTNNAALCIYRYCTADFGLRIATGRMGEDSFIEAANICDEDVATGVASPNPTQKRYTVDGAFTLDSAPLSVVESLLSACAGMMVDSQGLYKLFVGAYRTPTFELVDGDFMDELQITPGLPYSERFNRVSGTFNDPDQGYTSTDFPAVANSTYQDDDGAELTRPMDLPFTTDAIRAQRLAKIHLERSRQGLVAQGKFFFNAFRVVAGEPIQLTNAEYGWSQKVFLPLMRRVAADHVYLVLQEEASGVYDWNSGEETTYDLAPNTNLPDFTNPQPPASITLESGATALETGTDGTLTPRILVMWEAAPDVLVDGYEISWFPSNQSGETYETRTVGRDTRQTYISPVMEGDQYTVAVRSTVLSQYRSNPVEEANHVVVGKTAAPSPPDTFALEILATGTRVFTFTDANPDPDVRSGGGYQILYYLGSTSDVGVMTALNTPGVLTSSPYETTQLAAGVYTFALRTIDSSGNPSDTAIFINNAILGDPPLRNVLLDRLSSVEGWPGTKTDCFVAGDGTLRGNSVGTWDDATGTWDSYTEPWDTFLGTVSQVVYRSPVIDLTVDTSFQPLITVTSNGAQTIQIRWALSADGSPDAGSPVVPFEAVPAGEIAARYIQFEATLDESVSPSVQLVFDEIQLILDAEGKVDRYNDVDTSSFTAPYFESLGTGHFKMATKSQQMSAITQAAVVAFQSTSGGVWTAEIVSKSETVGGQPAAEIKLYNSGVAADATIDLELRGPKT